MLYFKIYLMKNFEACQVPIGIAFGEMDKFREISPNNQVLGFIL